MLKPKKQNEREGHVHLKNREQTKGIERTYHSICGDGGGGLMERSPKTDFSGVSGKGRGFSFFFSTAWVGKSGK